MLLFAGLGNPGQNYAMNRHNVGFMAVNLLAERYGFPAWQKKSTALQSAGRIGTDKIILVKPQSYMNKSGLPVAEVARFHKISPDNIFVFHDELDLAAGRLRVKQGGGHGGHNGLRDIIGKLSGQQDFYRLRLGIGHPGKHQDVVNYVLRKAPDSEYTLFTDAMNEALHYLPDAICGEWQKAMHGLHSAVIT